ncbi:DUF488 domain-containing protein [Arthrobacter sp. 35W]|uniref:DUF488 domain-containing protein n=1 Tax=Arthrobacter sp. 35W TaxID=1132441 RepID=UPI0003FF3345|nr:DUF488 family protein [Arthrobacter sp. 35W]
MGTVRILRVYDDGAPGELRVLVDRLWPRGVKKERVDLWLKDAAPSPELRIFFDHRAERFAEFAAAYRAELADNPAVDQIRELARDQDVALVYGARDPAINHAVVLLAAVEDAAQQG